MKKREPPLKSYLHSDMVIQKGLINRITKELSSKAGYLSAIRETKRFRYVEALKRSFSFKY